MEILKILNENNDLIIKNNKKIGSTDIKELVEYCVKNDISLSYANLEGANLRGTKLNGADLIGADLRKADLRRANLLGANLIGAYLFGADLIGADIRGANLNCVFYNTKITEEQKKMIFRDNDLFEVVK